MNEDRDELTTEGYILQGRYQGNAEQRAPRKSLQTEILARLGLTEQPVLHPVEVLRDPENNWIVRIQALQTLVQARLTAMGAQEITGILNDHSTHPALRAAAARALTELWRLHLISLDSFINALSDPDLDVRVAAIQALKAVEPRNIPDTLLERLLALLKESEQKDAQEHVHNDQYRRVRIAIIQCLGLLKRGHTFSLLENALDDRDWEIRDAVVQSIGAIVKSLPPNDAACIRLQASLEAMIDHEEEPVVLQSLILAFKDHTLFRNRLLRGSNRVKIKVAQMLGDAGEQANAKELEADMHVLTAVAKDYSEDSVVRSAAILRLAQLARSARPREQNEIRVLLSILSYDTNRGVQDAIQILQDVTALPSSGTASSMPRRPEENPQIRMNDFRQNRNDT